MTNVHEITSERHESIYLIESSVESIGKCRRENSIRFRLTGVPPSQAIKHMQINSDHSIAEIKKYVQREYKLNPILRIQFIFKGKGLPDHLNFEKIGIHLANDTITVMSTQGAGAKMLSKLMKRRGLVKYE